MRVPKSIVVGVAVSWPVGGAATLAEARTVATNAAAASETRNFTRIPTTQPVRGGRVVSQPLPELLATDAEDFDPPLQLLARRLAFVDPVTGEVLPDEG